MTLTWELHDTETRPTKIAVERRIGNAGPWQRIATEPATTQFTDSSPGPVVCYRVRALNDQGESAFSNIVRTP